MTTPYTTAFVDQFEAASRDASRALHGIAGVGRVPVIECTDTHWIKTRLAALIEQLIAGNGEICEHLSPYPSVCYSAAWAPARVVCSRCLDELRPDSFDDITCDRCHRATVTQLGTAAFGPLLLAYGLCDDCETATNQPTGERH